MSIAMQRFRRALRALATAIAAGGLFWSVALAQEAASFALQPVSFDPATPETQSYFIFNAASGLTIQSEVRIVNAGTAAGTVWLYPVDMATGQTSGTVFRLRDDPRQAVGTWVALGAQELTLQPGEGPIVPFTVTIPPETGPGQYVGGLIAEDVQLKGGAGTRTGPGAGMQVAVRNRVGLAIQVNLPGPTVEQIDVTGISPVGKDGYQKLLVGLRNSGTVMLKPTGVLQVANAQGQVVQDLKLKLDTFLPQTAIDYPVLVEDKALGAGDYQASLVLNYGDNQETRYSGAFAITPKQVEQVFAASKPLAPPEATTSTPSDAPTAGSGLMLIALGAGGMCILMLLGAAGWVIHRRRQTK